MKLKNSLCSFIFILPFFFLGCGNDDNKRKEAGITQEDIDLAKNTAQTVRTWSYKLREFGVQYVQFYNTLSVSLNQPNLDHDASLTANGMGIALEAIGTYYRLNLPIGTESAPQVVALSSLVNPNKLANSTLTITGNFVHHGSFIRISQATFSSTNPDNSALRTCTLSLDVSIPSRTGEIFELSVNSGMAETDLVSLSFINKGTARIVFDKTVDILNPVGLPIEFSLNVAAQLKTKSVNPVSFNGQIEMNSLKINNNGQIFAVPRNIKLAGTFEMDGIVDKSSLEYIIHSDSVFNTAPMLVKYGDKKTDLGSYSYSPESLENNIPAILKISTIEGESFKFEYSANTKILTKYDCYNNYLFCYVADSKTNIVSLNQYFSGLTAEPIEVSIPDEGTYVLNIPASLVPGVDNVKLSGTLMEPKFRQDKDHWLDFMVRNTREVNLPNMPKALLIFEIDRTGFRAGAARLSLAYDNVALALNIEGSSTAGVDGDILTLTGNLTANVNDAGSKTVLEVNVGSWKITGTNSDTNNVSGNVTVNGKQVATIKKPENSTVIIDYADGTFETLVI